jgi:hypothetical protein
MLVPPPAMEAERLPGGPLAGHSEEDSSGSDGERGGGAHSARSARSVRLPAAAVPAPAPGSSLLIPDGAHLRCVRRAAIRSGCALVSELLGFLDPGEEVVVEECVSTECECCVDNDHHHCSYAMRSSGAS